MKKLDNDLSLLNNSYNINITAYRAIKILQFLLEKPATTEEIIEYLKNDELTKRSISEDTLRVTMNSLKVIGCNILRPCKKNNYKYVLLSHPFRRLITREQIKILIDIRQYFVNRNNFSEILAINSLYDKIISLMCDEKLADLLNYGKPFVKVRPEVIKVFQTKELRNKEIIMTYSSTSNKTETIQIFAESVFCEAGRLYVLGRYPKRNSISYFNAEKIVAFRSIKKIKKTDTANNTQLKEIKSAFIKAIYKVYNEDAKIFECSANEKIICKKSNYIIVESIVKSDFKFFQQLLSLGHNFELIEPIELKEKLLEKIQKIRERYKK